MSGDPTETAIINSALWAAAGDALGWITELGDANTVRARTGNTTVERPIPWKRRIGGRAGVTIDLPEGVYSDDTQLRLAVCRSIRGDGTFDPETFARIELTVWPTYALGAGRGSKGAAANLTKRGVNWFSNLFETKGQSYCSAGGNGAAMRIQPHVWANRDGDQQYLVEVVRDAIITHGHPHGFCGALFHAMCVADAVAIRKVPEPGAWLSYLQSLRALDALVQSDRQLGAFWLPAWTEHCGGTLDLAVAAFLREAEQDVIRIRPLLDDGPTAYHSILRALGCFEDRFRGSGWKTALAAIALSWIYRDESPELALEAAANALGTDTDTIGTMAGAITGAGASEPPSWPIQDRSYIESEARRLALIARGKKQDSFAYPDPARWQPPTSQADAVLIHDGGLAVVGLGPATPMGGRKYESGQYVWQWLKLSFGQTILAKRRSLAEKEAKSSQLPKDRRPAAAVTYASELPLDTVRPPQNYGGGPSVVQRSKHVTTTARAIMGAGPIQNEPSVSGVDAWTDFAIQADFDDRTLGRMLNKCIDELGTVEAAAAFAGVIAKAKLTRRRRKA